MSVFVAQAQVPICNGSYNLVTTMTQPDCFGGQGQVTLSVQGFSNVFKARWLADNDEVLSKSLFSGTYTYKVWIPGQAGCSDISESPTYSVVVTQPSVVVPNASIKSYPSCAPSQGPNGPDGILKVAPTGGTSVFLYKVDWDPVIGSAAFQNGTSFVSGQYERLGSGPGTYTVAVRDDNGCLSQETIGIPSGIPPAMTLSGLVTNPACSGQVGSIAISVVNGANGPLLYSLLNPLDPTDTIASNYVGMFSNVDEGHYNVSVSDQLGCSVQGNYEVNAPNPFGFSVDQVSNIQCYGESDGSIAIGLSGGASPYSVFIKDLNLNPIQFLTLISPGSNQKPSSLQRVFSSGNYFAYSIDAGGCVSDSVYFTINEPVSNNVSTALTIAGASVSACFPGTQSGKINTTASGGYPPYSYAFWSGNRIGDPRLWDVNGIAQGWPPTAGAADELNNLVPGTYTIGVKDQYGCQRRTLLEVETRPNILLSQQLITNVDCNGNSNGSITVIASGGESPLSYQLLPAGIQQFTPTFEALSVGPYQVKVVDNYGCESSPLSMNITEPDVLTGTVAITRNPSCNPGLGSFSYTITGGTMNYQVLLNGVVSRTISTLSSSYSQNVPQGTYSFLVRDQNGCESALENFTISGPPSPGINGNGLSVSVAGFQHVSCPSGTNGFVQLSIQGGWPAVGGYTIEVESVTSYVDRLGNTRVSYLPFLTTNNSLIDNLPAGKYQFRVKDSYGCSRTVQQLIVQPDPIVPSFNGITGNCGGSGNSTQANGGVTLNGISGGTPPYSYTINGIGYSDIPNFFPNLNLSGLIMVITDSNNCLQYYP